MVGYPSDGVPMALPVLPIQSCLLLCPRLVMGAQAAIQLCLRLQTQMRCVRGAAPCPRRTPKSHPPMKKPVLLLFRRNPFRRKQFCFLSTQQLNSHHYAPESIPRPSALRTVLQVLT